MVVDLIYVGAGAVIFHAHDEPVPVPADEQAHGARIVGVGKRVFHDGLEDQLGHGQIETLGRNVQRDGHVVLAAGLLYADETVDYLQLLRERDVLRGIAQIIAHEIGQVGENVGQIVVAAQERAAADCAQRVADKVRVDLRLQELYFGLLAALLTRAHLAQQLVDALDLAVEGGIQSIHLRGQAARGRGDGREAFALHMLRQPADGICGIARDQQDQYKACGQQRRSHGEDDAAPCDPSQNEDDAQ